jgi:hypothetical protein
MRISGRVTSSLAIGASAASATSVTRLGSKPCSASTSREISTVIAKGRTAPGWGLTTTALPVTRLAKNAG